MQYWKGVWFFHLRERSKKEIQSILTEPDLGRSLRTEPEKRLVHLQEINTRRRSCPVASEVNAQGYVARRERIQGNVESD